LNINDYILKHKLQYMCMCANTLFQSLFVQFQAMHLLFSHMATIVIHLNLGKILFYNPPQSKAAVDI
jgi:hypothetical protein